MSDEVNHIIEDALRPLINGPSYYANEPFFELCSAAIREALKTAGYVIAPPPTVKGQ